MSEVEPPGFKVKRDRGPAYFFHFSVNPDMLIDFNRLFKENFINFERDQLWGEAHCTTHCASRLVKPWKHCPAKQVIIDTYIAGFAYFGGDQLHEETKKLRTKI